MVSIKRAFTYAFALSAMALGPQALARDFTGRPIELIIGYAAGSSSDLLARYYAMEL